MKKTLAKKGLQKRAYLLLIALLALAAVITINIGLDRLDRSAYLRVDLSPDSLGEVSDRTRAILTGLDEELSITVARSSGGESALGSLIDELLSRYTSLSDRVNVTYVDPAAAPYVIARFNPSGREVEENTVFLSNADGTRIRRVDASQLTYLRTLDGTVYSLFCGDARLSGMMMNLLSKDVRRAYFLTGHGEKALPDCGRFALSLSATGYEVSDLSLGAVTPTSSDLVIIIAPTADITSRESKALSAFLDGGGRLLIAYDAFTPQDRLQTLSALLDLYGLKYESGTTVESVSEKGGYIDSPVWLCPEISDESDVTKDITERIIFKDCCAIAEPRHITSFTTTRLLSTSPKAYRKLVKGDLYTFEQGDASGRQLLALIREATREGGARIAQIASVEPFLDDATLGESNLMDCSANLEFLGAVVSRLAGEEALNASAELKIIPNNLIAFSSGLEQSRVMALSVALPPTVILMVCLIVLINRRRRAR